MGRALQEPERWVRTFRGARTTAAVPPLSVVAYPRTLPATPAVGVSFAPFAGAAGVVWGHLQWRAVTATAHGRTVGPWLSLPTFPGTPAGEPVTLTGSRGRTYEYRVRATDRADSSAASAVTGWSPPQAAALAQDATTATGSVAAGMTQTRQRGAFGGTVLRSDRAGGSWTSRPFFGTELALVVTVGPRGSHADVHVDGRRVAAVSTYDPRITQRQTRYLLRGLSPGTPHTVTVVNRPRDPRRALLELDAFVVTSTR